jgi:4-amino-4-deoxy-L-arabinose transferase-like glycosyltransferase
MTYASLRSVTFPQHLGRRGKLVFFVICLGALIASHWSDLSLPYFWDEAGYFVPAALDLFGTGDPIPSSVAPNPHPPLVAASLATAWHLFGFSTVVTRLTMLCWAAVALLAVYVLCEWLGGFRLGIAACLCTFTYPVFFAQSALAQLDLPAAAMTLWGVFFYARGKLWASALTLSCAILCKESAAVAVASLLLFECLSIWRGKRIAAWTSLATLFLPAVVLALWLLFVYVRTGNVLGNAEFSRYNVGGAALTLSRFLAALLHRTWDAAGHFFLFLLTLPAALSLIPFRGRPAGREGGGVPLLITMTMALYAVAFSVLGGAILARYMLTAAVLAIVLSIYLVSRRWRHWWVLVPVTLVAFGMGLLTPPPYHYAYDENLAYRDFIEVHRRAAVVLSAERLPVITTWPATDELSKPYLGYVRTGLAVVAVPDLSVDSIGRAADQCRGCAILFFPTQYEPSESILRPGAVLRRFRFWAEAQQRFETRPAKLSPEALAAAIGAEITWRWRAGPVYAAVLRLPGSK